MIELVWIVCAIFTAVIAGSKGRNVFGWLILGALFSIFALIAVAAMPRIEGPKAPSKTCPACAESVLVEATVCRHCGHAFDPTETRRAVATATARINDRESSQRIGWTIITGIAVVAALAIWSS